jgi:sortase B
MAKGFLRWANGLVSLVMTLALLTAGGYASYCLWDNSQIYAAAENVQAELLHLKPKIAADATAGEAGPTFDELIAVNPDVCAWVTMDQTQIDHAVLQGETNLSYINTDVYGNFALAGSIFLDSRNDRSFADPYSLLYGHHMENSGMFGDLDRYKDPAFFAENTTGTLILPDRVYALETFACLLVSASEDRIFSPETWAEGIDGLLHYAQSDAMHTREAVIAQLRARIEAGEQPQVLALSTCASEFTDARTIVLAAMREISWEDREDVQP